MAAVDLAAYAALLSLDRDHISSLTADLTINFLKRPPSTDLLAECNILTIDSVRAVAKAVIFPFREPDDVICSSICTYSIHQG